MNNNFLNQHKCEAAVLICMDFRFHNDLYRHVKEVMKIESFDLLAMAGSAKDLIENGPGKEAILRDFSISKDLHKAGKVIIVHHIDCGAYGGSKNFESREKEIEFQKDQLYRAKNLIRSNKNLADMEIILLFVNEKDGKPEYVEV